MNQRQELLRTWLLFVPWPRMGDHSTAMIEHFQCYYAKWAGRRTDELCEETIQTFRVICGERNGAGHGEALQERARAALYIFVQPTALL